jgi:CHASE3 domain sensor protein
MDVLAFLIMVLLLLAMGRLVLAALAIQKNTREVADHFKWLRERQEAQSQAANQRAGTTKS